MKKLLLTLMIMAASNSAFAAEKEYLMKVHGAVCASCAYGLEKKFMKIDGVKAFDVDFKAGIVSICADETVKFTEAQLTTLFKESGYSYKGKEVENSCTDSLVSSGSKTMKQKKFPEGKRITLTGLYNGMCEDGEDFYFMYKSEIMEVVPPKEGMPENITIGTPLKVQGVVINSHGEDEVKIQARIIDVK